MVAIMTPTSLTQPFWDAAARHVLVRQQCNVCGTSFFTPQIACCKCQSEDWQWATSSGQGTLYSVTRVYKAPVPDFPVPYALAIVALDEGWNMLSNVVNGPVEDVFIGMRVKVVFQRTWEGFQVPEFEPDTAPGAGPAA